MASQLTDRHWIGGDWIDAQVIADSINPATGEPIGTTGIYTEARETEARGAIAAALRTFKETGWREDRRPSAKALNEMADHFEVRTDDLVEIHSLENGKIKPEARFEVSKVPSQLRFYAALVLTDFERTIETAAGR